MGVYIKGVEMPKGELGAVPVIIFADGTVHHYFTLEKVGEAVPVHPHGRLIDADELLNRAFGTGLFGEDYMRLLEELVGGSSTIIPAEEE